MLSNNVQFFTPTIIFKEAIWSLARLLIFFFSYEAVFFFQHWKWEKTVIYSAISWLQIITHMVEMHKYQGRIQDLQNGGGGGGEKKKT